MRKLLRTFEECEVHLDAVEVAPTSRKDMVRYTDREVFREELEAAREAKRQAGST